MSNPFLKLFHVCVVLVLFACSDAQIVWSVVVSDSVHMVDDFFGGQLSTEYLFHHNPVLEYLALPNRQFYVATGHSSATAPLWVVLPASVDFDVSANYDPGSPQAPFHGMAIDAKVSSDLVNIHAAGIEANDFGQWNRALFPSASSMDPEAVKSTKNDALRSVELGGYLGGGHSALIQSDDFSCWNTSTERSTHTIVQLYDADVLASGF